MRSHRKADIVFDATVQFCERFLTRKDRTYDQMIQAARSGKQNIGEGSQASGTSKKMEIKLTSVARSSLEELLEDYRDFLRSRRLPLWQKNSPSAQSVRRRAYDADESYETYRAEIEEGSAETAANVAICLIHQANYLLDRQIGSLEEAFLKEGGLSERMTRARLAHRKQQWRRKE